MKYIYVAGPLTSGDLFTNVNAAVEYGDALMLAGYIPYVPHLSVLWAMIRPNSADYTGWLEYDFAWLAKCDALLRLPGDSPGADKEELEAKKLGIPVFYGLKELVDCEEDLTNLVC